MAFSSPHQPQPPQPQPFPSQPLMTTTQPPPPAPPPPTSTTYSQPSRRLLIFQETRNPHNTAETVYLPVNKLGLPICGLGQDLHLPSLLELPLRVLKAFTEIFNQPKYKGWAVVAAGPHRDASEQGTFYAVVLEQAREVMVVASSSSSPSSS